MSVVHVLRSGFAVCGFGNCVPGEWPDGHMWVRDEDRGEATCADCLRRLDGFPGTREGDGQKSR